MEIVVELQPIETQNFNVFLLKKHHSQVTTVCELIGLCYLREIVNKMNNTHDLMVSFSHLYGSEYLFKEPTDNPKISLNIKTYCRYEFVNCCGV